MRPEPNPLIEPFRTDGPAHSNLGRFQIPKGSGLALTVMCSNGGGWDHVSVSLPGRCPTWSEMSMVKHLFFHAEEAVMQLHPPESAYVNNHPYCLHMWRPQTTEEIAAVRKLWEAAGEEWPDFYPSEPCGAIPMPPAHMVGLKQLSVPSMEVPA